LKSAAAELGQYNITVNAIIPGLVDTPLTRYEKRLSESMAENGRPVVEILRLNKRGLPRTSALCGAAMSNNYRPGRAARFRNLCRL
jgi:NAD(P)-dependent dehydrogenase (short-subunit alcohol dehydrogenase family)